MTGLALARVVQTCSACPSQWDAWTTDGRYLYLRYRGGVGTVDQFLEPGQEAPTSRTLVELLDAYPVPGVPFTDVTLAEFDTRDGMGEIDLERFCELAGLVLPHGVEVTHEPGPMYALEARSLDVITSLVIPSKRSPSFLREFFGLMLDAAGNGPAVRAVERQQAPPEPETPG